MQKTDKEKGTKETPEDGTTEGFALAESANGPISPLKWIGFIGGLFVFVLMILASPPEGLSLAGWRTAAVATLMATWWVTEVIPISATAMLPLVLFPILGVGDIAAAATPYAHPMIFLFLGGFIIAIAMQRWDLHRRIALNIIALIGSKPRSIIAGFMVSAAFMSMWVSNTASTMMMLPIAMSVIMLTRSPDHSIEDQKQYTNFGLTLMLAIAFSASVGGLGTVIGTPTNALMIAFVDDAYGIQINFAEWMLIGLPVVILGLPVIFYTLANLVYPVKIKSLPGGRKFILDELKSLGKITRPEVLVAVIFTLVGVLWMTRPLIERTMPEISDAGIAIFGALLLFLIPVDLKNATFLMRWKDAEKLPWGVLILFGGGLSLAGAIQRTGLAEWVGGFFAILSGWHVILILFIVAIVIITFTELASNSATAAAFLPVIGSVAISVGQDPLLFAVPVALVASCAFMLPVATPPNAIVYGSGVMTIPQMAKAGFTLNIFFAILVTLLTYFLFSVMLGIEIGHIPASITQ
ncbi:DASS family sodium-coupled anion symporter [Rhodohalobacter sp. SW132]|uniref:SLC13 family permease n=1 Tax=Rhodohalobacter sp. SW132 TaxID=2293433 RepID=UPI0018F3C57C|nr:DASS family sodium-coupled anion symporter [Rhodohalobacter sp. SW132]